MMSRRPMPILKAIKLSNKHRILKSPWLLGETNREIKQATKEGEYNATVCCSGCSDLDKEITIDTFSKQGYKIQLCDFGMFFYVSWKEINDI